MKGFASWVYNASWFTLGIAFASILLFGIVAVQAATTISANISTGGTLDVTGLSTLGGYISTASSTISAGQFTVLGKSSLQQASTTDLTAAGNLWVNGFATTTGANGNFATQGTLGVTGLSTLMGGFVSQASSTVAGGALTAAGTLRASSTFQATGAARFYSTLEATGASTLTGDVTMGGGSGALTLTTTNTATSTATIGCIQTYATSTDTAIRMEFTTSAVSTTTHRQGAAQIGGTVVWIFGTCP